MGKKNRKQGEQWQEAKRRCGLSDEDIRMAKELGFRPHSLLKNIPGKSQPWKAPVRDWIRGLYAKRLGKARRSASPQAPRGGGSPAPPAHPTAENPEVEELLPQYDTQTGEIYFARAGDDTLFSMDDAGDHPDPFDAVPET